MANPNHCLPFLLLTYFYLGKTSDISLLSIISWFALLLLWDPVMKVMTAKGRPKNIFQGSRHIFEYSRFLALPACKPGNLAGKMG
ncbi:MAG: hypothetical protein R2744_01010 [Bacteroidales bacterium]